VELVIERERQGGSFLGRHLAVPHGRLPGAAEPLVVVARPSRPIPVEGPLASQPGGESVKLLIILLTPADTPRIHQVLLSHIALMYDSDFLEERLYEAKTSRELKDVLVTAEQVVLG
jgi:PTS system nitrogen regulatory IIA component